MSTAISLTKRAAKPGITRIQPHIKARAPKPDASSTLVQDALKPPGSSADTSEVLVQPKPSSAIDLDLTDCVLSLEACIAREELDQTELQPKPPTESKPGPETSRTSKDPLQCEQTKINLERIVWPRVSDSSPAAVTPASTSVESGRGETQPTEQQATVPPSSQPESGPASEPKQQSNTANLPPEIKDSRMVIRQPKASIPAVLSPGGVQVKFKSRDIEPGWSQPAVTGQEVVRQGPSSPSERLTNLQKFQNPINAGLYRNVTSRIRRLDLESADPSLRGRLLQVESDVARFKKLLGQHLKHQDRPTVMDRLGRFMRTGSIRSGRMPVPPGIAGQLPPQLEKLARKISNNVSTLSQDLDLPELAQVSKELDQAFRSAFR